LSGGIRKRQARIANMDEPQLVQREISLTPSSKRGINSLGLIGVRYDPRHSLPPADGYCL
jgi:hypothetical protein